MKMSSTAFFGNDTDLSDEQVRFLLAEATYDRLSAEREQREKEWQAARERFTDALASVPDEEYQELLERRLTGVVETLNLGEPTEANVFTFNTPSDDTLYATLEGPDYILATLMVDDEAEVVHLIRRYTGDRDYFIIQRDISWELIEILQEVKLL